MFHAISNLHGNAGWGTLEQNFRKCGILLVYNSLGIIITIILNPDYHT